MRVLACFPILNENVEFDRTLVYRNIRTVRTEHCQCQVGNGIGPVALQNRQHYRIIAYLPSYAGLDNQLGMPFGP